MMQVVALNEIMMPKAMNLLFHFRESSLFLLNNLREHGPRRRHHPNSGNFRCVIDAAETVRAVFCLVNRGTLLAHGDPLENYTNLILEDISEEPIPVRGFIGPWDIVNPLHQGYCELHSDFHATFSSREIMFTAQTMARPGTPNNPAVRLLTPDDFPQWAQLNSAYLHEEGLPSQITEEQRQKLFVEKTQRKYWWGCFDGPKMVGIASFNAHFETIAQLGGVYTLPDYRRKGVARAVINRIFSDATNVHKISTLSIFTGENNAGAQKLYESIGFQRAGIFGMILGG